MHSSELDDGYNWARLGGVSVTEQGGLEEFLATAELAGTEFTAERLNVQIVTETQNEALPSVAQQRYAAFFPCHLRCLPRPLDFSLRSYKTPPGLGSTPDFSRFVFCPTS